MNLENVLVQLRAHFHGNVEFVDAQGDDLIFSWELPVWHSMIRVNINTGTTYTLSEHGGWIREWYWAVK